MVEREGFVSCYVRDGDDGGGVGAVCWYLALLWRVGYFNVLSFSASVFLLELSSSSGRNEVRLRSSAVARVAGFGWRD